ncbi:hypothetical protein VFPFJ_10890 [Purpureocillium lilacinum]|uniref:Uncharacterized protein n=1 Tax=Purpureocillium lilacinum TaxID=33203 RepID=A0A179GD35_PURLI|nr:hypothetical protein VFPFJ_10890 [Purpureocillium lilacinum]OAQ75052.1 hypothetical protein VFPFJ_10890 [Purpureocillium lilacinum]OAQ75725.1 hypothetical protein VFPBJ_09698 [Purpureocillium lilacinum]
MHLAWRCDMALAVRPVRGAARCSRWSARHRCTPWCMRIQGRCRGTRNAPLAHSPNTVLSSRSFHRPRCCAASEAAAAVDWMAKDDRPTAEEYEHGGSPVETS